MTIAEIRGKISETGTNLSERMEDLLTSDIFGCLRYLRPDQVLLPFLETASSFRGRPWSSPGDIVKTHFSFWPWVKLDGCTPCEPDVVVGIETKGSCLHLLFVEAKYRSGLSSEEDEGSAPNDQLARELDNLDRITPLALHWPATLTIVSRTLFFITQDMGKPYTLMGQSLGEYQRKRNKTDDIYWTSWRFLQPILEIGIAQTDSTENKAVIEDMLNLMLRKGLTVFRGVEPVSSSFQLPQFYQVSPRLYSWPRISDIPGIGYKYEVKKK